MFLARDLAADGPLRHNCHVGDGARIWKIARMQHEIDAIYENGMFRPVDRGVFAIAEGQRVRITVDDEGDPEALRLAMSVYDGLSDNGIDEIKTIALDRGSFFGPRSDN